VSDVESLAIFFSLSSFGAEGDLSASDELFGGACTIISLRTPRFSVAS